ncbi:hypothetical protein E1B28_004369 [Marasmius oreades]|uniref:CCHC-type domain-containing protein n=1 Tax=Marasmius oreades TaxID=181124 RepID=A0A9P8ACW4_9AGAR|nr:uncharacterized protein E1B28_004369 [Marasmius oreades]KAG7096972.1 hypothetical protein E1B28_004369 [Marasmius oreades]
MADMFYIDLVPDPTLPSPHPTPPSPQATREPSTTSLLLPNHVSLLGSVPVLNLPSPSPPPEGDQNYIEFLDYGGADNGKGLVRYFETQEEQSTAPTVIICKRCNAKGEHKTVNCPVIICLTCGSRNEHTTHSCPISKVCFSCGMKGHINANCPNRGLRYNESKYDDCHRCGSSRHSTNECPTLWRLYDYLTETGRKLMLETRRARKDLPLGGGGEGYIAEDMWCYNCGGSGHWGDDCKVMVHNGDVPTEYSAFGSHNLFSGPFVDFDADQPSTSHRELRDWEREDYWGDHVPTNVGKKGRKKEMASLTAKATHIEEEGDTEDWFSRRKEPAVSSVDRGTIGHLPTRPGKMRVSIPKSLRDRLVDAPEERTFKRSKENDRRREKDRDRETREEDRGSNRSRDERRGEVGRGSGGRSLLERMTDNKPRYRGGYPR